MKKLLIYFASAFLTMSIFSCYKDKGNYAYVPNEVITVNGIASSYAKQVFTDTLNITPAVSSSAGNANFEYYWGIYQNSANPPVLDTISRSQNLNYIVSVPAGAWTIVFSAKNKTTGYQKLTTTSLQVSTAFSRGWFVLKDDGTHTDMDQFITPSTIVPTSQVNNVFSLANGKQLNGKAMFLAIDNSYKSPNSAGVYANTPSLFITASNDASILNMNTFQEIHNFNGMFFSPPATVAPQAMFYTYNSEFILNAGQLSGISTTTTNNGLFEAPQLFDASNTPCNLSKYFMAFYIYYFPIFFDQNSSTFISTSSGNSTLMSPIKDATTTAMPSKNNNKTLLYMGCKSPTTRTGVALFQDKTNTSLKILSIITANTVSFNMVNDTLASTEKLYNASLITTNVVDENMIYFVVGGNQLWSRNLTNNVEQLQYTAPSGETINYIRHRKYSYSLDLPFAFNYIIVGSTSGGNYKVRMFSKTAGNLNASPDFTMSGQGSVGDVIYNAPYISASTYFPTF